MLARAVIGANFGDEGKGLVTDYLCATQGAGMVVRFNGGAQAGHTVVSPAGRRHVFKHFGSGTLQGVPTYLSQFFVCNPLSFLREYDDLTDLSPVVYAHPNCLVTTFADMIINQRKEDARGEARHGSCGVGFHETLVRSSLPELQITLSDLWNGMDLRAKLATSCSKWAEFRTGKPIEDAEAMIEAFARACAQFAELVNPLGIAQCPEPIFEGAQGLLLDKDNKEFFPHVTHSHTGLHNVRLLCEQAGIKAVEPWYVSRTYLTRHGAGKLPGEDSTLRFRDDTNNENTWQGRMRFAELDAGLHARCEADAQGSFRLVLTHCDQSAPTQKADLYFHGPTREDCEKISRTVLTGKAV